MESSMILKNTLDLNVIKQKDLTFRFLKNGTLYDMTYNNIQINLQKGNPLDGSLSNIYLRFREDYNYIKLLSGPYLNHVTFCDEGVIYKGNYQDISYQVNMNLYEYGWTYDVSIHATNPLECDLYYGQDIGIQDANGILNNEAYIVQYIDYKAFETPQGFVLGARQNQGQPMYFQMGMAEKAIGFSTDAMQFFTPNQKVDGKIHALSKDLLPNRIYQYEASYLTLQSEPFLIDEKGIHRQFYGMIEPHHEEAIQTPIEAHFENKVLSQVSSLKVGQELLAHASFISGKALTLDEIAEYYPHRLHEEWNEASLLSWFLEDDSHVMTLQKEVLLERPQGHIIIQGDILNATSNILSTTSFMPGIFLSHLTLGNTSFHKFLGDHRHPLMLHKMAGLRLYIQKDGEWFLLAMPSLFEVGFQHVTWWYVFEEDTVKISVYGSITDSQVNLEWESLQGKTYEIIATMNLLMGSQEWMYDLSLKPHDRGFEVTIPENTMVHEQYPTLSYRLDSSVLLNLQKFDEGLIVYRLTSNKTFKFSVSADYKKPTYNEYSLKDVKSEGHAFFGALFEKVKPWSHPLIQKTDQILLKWYAHNALVHYASPHGLEQYNGAAWGTRDVCQGPFEFFSALQMDEPLKHILLTVYGRQFLETGDFPQWFMYDKYKMIQAHESHGDIIFWPLKALSYYLKQTKDFDILKKSVCYYSLQENQFGYETPLYDHVKHQIDAIFEHTIENLPIYGGGDWDDTLQPANETLKERMVSGWSAALMIQVLEAFSREIKSFDKEYSDYLITKVEASKIARKKYLLPDNIPAGFAIFNGDIEYLLHPKDTQTGLSYRLLPIIRSMIAKLTSPEEIKAYTFLIETHLKFPDGVRLMNTPVVYKGGTKKYFQRAETSANFGREIGLQYVHGHIRYLEAMIETDQYEKALEALKMIHPIEYHNNIPSAMPRQRNTYFSSSDALFFDRYEAKERFDEIKTGNIPVKGGWRIYSSGPGILIHQIIVGLCKIKRDTSS